MKKWLTLIFLYKVGFEEWKISNIPIINYGRAYCWNHTNERSLADECFIRDLRCQVDGDSAELDTVDRENSQSTISVNAGISIILEHWKLELTLSLVWYVFICIYLLINRKILRLMFIKDLVSISNIILFNICA
jgi:hypothetical protein